MKSELKKIAERKAAARAEDQRRLAQGEVTRDKLQTENSLIPMELANDPTWKAAALANVLKSMEARPEKSGESSLVKYCEKMRKAKTLKEHSMVWSTRTMPKYGISKRSVGTIVHVYNADFYEVEFTLKRKSPVVVTMARNDLTPVSPETQGALLRLEEKWQFRRQFLLKMADRLEATPELWDEIQTKLNGGLETESTCWQLHTKRWIRFAGKTRESTIRKIREKFGPETPEGRARHRLQDTTEASPFGGILSNKELMDLRKSIREEIWKKKSPNQ